MALGWDVTIYEQAPAFGLVGAGILLAPNAVRALGWLGLEELRSKLMMHGGVAIRDKSGRLLFRARAEKLEEHFGVPSIAFPARKRGYPRVKVTCGYRLTQ